MTTLGYIATWALLIIAVVTIVLIGVFGSEEQ